ncbi:MAG: LytTR family transcriptional regulator DNA-binding domain-containing protein, partial [Bacteroidota bacterium]
SWNYSTKKKAFLIGFIIIAIIVFLQMISFFADNIETAIVNIRKKRIEQANEAERKRNKKDDKKTQKKLKDLEKKIKIYESANKDTRTLDDVLTIENLTKLNSQKSDLEEVAIPFKDINFIQTVRRNYIEIHYFQDGKPQVLEARLTILNLYNRLPSTFFAKINRGTIVSLKEVNPIKKHKEIRLKHHPEGLKLILTLGSADEFKLRWNKFHDDQSHV